MTVRYSNVLRLAIKRGVNVRIVYDIYQQHLDSRGKSTPGVVEMRKGKKVYVPMHR